MFGKKKSFDPATDLRVHQTNVYDNNGYFIGKTEKKLQYRSEDNGWRDISFSRWSDETDVYGIDTKDYKEGVNINTSVKNLDEVTL